MGARYRVSGVLHHLSIAQGSLAEVETQLELSGRLTYIQPDQLRSILAEASALGKQLYSLRNGLKRR